MQLEIPLPRTIFSVTQITNTLSRIIQQQPQLQNVWVKGQVSNLSRPKSGHIYFTLKDDKSNIRGVLWKSIASKLQFLPRDGEEVLVHGKINIYAAGSEYQIVVDKVDPLGIGALQRAFQELKKKLADEGLFDDRHKKPLPKFPKKIGVVTSKTGAAIQDIRQQLQTRYPLAELLLYPASVQGENAVPDIVKAIRALNNRMDVDVMIVGRGGGSVEDLSPFNEEIVARAIFDSNIPIVSAVGHETDYTISDMVADHRSPTPTAAVEHVVPDRLDLLGQLGSLNSQLNVLIKRRLTDFHAQIDTMVSGLSPAKRRETIFQYSQTVDRLEVAYQKAINDRLESEKNQLQSFASRLNSLSPLATLDRGYSICKTSSGDIVTSTNQVNVGEKLDIKLSEGNLVCTVDECLD